MEVSPARPVLLVLSGLALVAAALAGGMWLADAIEERRLDEEVTLFAARADEQAEALRSIYLRPLHDVRATRAPAREQLAAITEELGLDRRDDAPVEAMYRVGQLALALGDVELARRHLDRAWDRGARRSAVALDRVRAHDRRRRDRQRLGVPAGDASALVESLDARVDALAGSAADLETAAWLDALRAFHLGEEEALDEVYFARVAEDLGTPEARLLHADVRLRIARSTRGPFEPAAEAYQRAIARAPSDPRGYVGLCATWTAALAAEMRLAEETSTIDSSTVPIAHVGRAETACADGLVADPEDPALLVAMARLQRLAAELDRRHGRDPSPSVATAEEAARRALGDSPVPIDPEWTPSALRHLGEARLVRARWLAERGEDPATDLDAARTALRQALDLRPDDPDLARALESVESQALSDQ